MNAKQVLSKIATLLFEDKEAVEFVDAKTRDGVILQSPTFDVGEKVEVVSEDGTKSPAPDGEHEIALKDTEGNEVLIKIETKDGVITERENVELPEAEAEGEEEEMGEPKTTDVNEVVKGLEMAKEAETYPAHALPNTTDEDPRNRLGTDEDDKKDPIIALSYRITELENKLKDLTEKFEAATPAEAEADEETAEVEMEEVSVPKLDGAPIEEAVSKFSAVNKIKNTERNYQSSFLEKLYK